MGNVCAAAARVRSTHPSPNALRLRRARDRRRQGLASFRIDVSTDDFVDALVESHRLTEREVQELRRPQIERELTASSESESAT
jgi:hypothetical protein